MKQYESAAASIVGKKNKGGLMEVYEQILHLKPDKPKVVLSLFRLYYQKKAFEKIVNFFEKKATEQVQSDDEIHYLASEAYLRLDQTQESKKRMKILYEKKLAGKDWKASDYLYGRIRQEFEMDDDYFKKVEEIRISAGRPEVSLPDSHKAETPKDRPDLERTDEFSVAKIDAEKNKSSKDPEKK